MFILGLFIGTLLGIGATLFFSAKAITHAEIEANESAEIVRKLIHDGNTTRNEAWGNVIERSNL